ncbi:ataxin-2 isoform X5 [Erinaceus europaeus]|uniref:Ataxin-2 isoform X5 n=1 Tax=Erinaceus europaeus TaxID=9365 RepID=A0ABM3XJV3_ERIEU|nr:ataxin-2 isoform X5 [Erinaceus europaeus]
MRSAATAPQGPAVAPGTRRWAATRWAGRRSPSRPARRGGRGGGGSGAAPGPYPSAAPPPPGPGPPPTGQRSPPSASDCFGSNGHGGIAPRLGSRRLLGFGGPPCPLLVLLLPIAGPGAPLAAPARATRLGARASPPHSGVSSARPAPGCPRPACGPVYGRLTMSLKPQQPQQPQQPPAVAGARKPGGSSGLLSSSAAAPPLPSAASSSAAASSASASASSSAAAGGGRPGLGRGRNNNKGLTQSTISFDGIYANVRMVHILTSVVGSKCEVQVKNGGVYEGVFKTYSPKCDLVLDAAHEKSTESNLGPKREEIMESILFKCSDFVVVQFKDMDSSYARRVVPSETDAFTDSAISAKVNGEHKEKDLEPWDAGDLTTSEELEALENDVSNGWDPNDMFRYNEENYGVVSTYDSSLSSYTVPLERDNSEEFLKREARANQLAEEIESSAQYKARVALENDDRSEEEKYTAVQRNSSEREGHSINTRENKYIPPGQRNREVISWGSGRQNSPRMGQSGSGSLPSRSSSHTSDFNPNSGSDQRVVNGGVPWPSPCPSPSSRPPSRYQSGPNSLPPRAATPTRPPSRPPSRPSRPPSHPSAHGSPAPVSTMPKRMSSEGPPRMSPKAQRHPRNHRVSAGRGSISSGLEFVAHAPPNEAVVPPAARTSPAGGTWSSVVSGVPRLSPKTHRPRSPRQNSIGNSPSGPVLASPQAGIIPTEAIAMPVPAASPTPASPASNRAVTPSIEAKDSRLQDQRQNSPAGNKENMKPNDTSSFSKAENKGLSPIVSEHRRQIDDLKKFKNDFRLQPSSTSDSMDQLLNKSREGEKSRDLIKDKIDPNAKDSFIENSSDCASGGSKPSSPSISPPSTLSSTERKRGPDVTSQGVQTSSPGCKQEKDDKEEKKDAAEQVRKSTLNPNAKEFNPRSFSQPKPSTTPTSPRPQAQPSPSMVGHQQPTPVYTQPVCFAPNMMYPVPVSPGVQPLYPIPMTPMPVNQAKTYRAGKVPNMPQQRQDQHHQSTMMHPASAAGPPIVATPPAYSAQYVAYSPQQFPNQPLVQHVPHYQSQHPHVYSPVIQGNARMMAPPTHAQPGLVSSSATQYGAHEQTHAMYVSTGSLAQQYAHPNATLHPHPPHPQPSATPTGQQQSQHGGSHPAPSPVQHHQHQAAQALHLASPQQQSAIYHAGLAPTPPSMTPASNTQSPQNSFPAAQQTVFTIHPSHVQPAYTNPPHMAHVPQYKPTTNSSCKAALEEPKGQIPSSLLLLLPTGSTEN